jgi:hypothetical protein
MTQPEARTTCRSLATVDGFLVCIEIAGGVLQGYYTPT